MTEMRRFQFWENFYMPLKRIKDRSARAELALKILEAAFEDEPPEFDDMEGLVADSVVPLIRRDMETPKGGRGRKTASKASGKPTGKANENVSETSLETGFESGLSDPFKAKLKLCFLKKQSYQRALLRTAQLRHTPRSAQKPGPMRGPAGRGPGAAAASAGGTCSRRPTARWRAPGASRS